MAKNLKSFLEDLNKDQMVYLGTKDGSSWVSIETAGTILENLDKLNDLLYRQVTRSNRDARKLCKEFPVQIARLLSKIEKTTDKEELDKLKYDLASYEKRFVLAYERREKTGKALSNWKEVKDRKVVDTYDHTVYVPGISVLIEGFELGELWFKDEKKVI